MIRWLSILLMWLAAGQATAQQGDEALQSSTDILVVDMQRLYEESEYSKGRLAILNVQVKEFINENNRLTEELKAEELELAQKRATLPYEEFRVLVDAFNEKVQRIRSDQDTKQNYYNQLRKKNEADFISKVTPVLEQLLKESGASVMLFKGEQNPLLALPRADITDMAIKRINAKLGNGTAVPR